MIQNQSVLVLGVQSSVALASVRSLANKGYRVIGISFSPDGAGLASKHLAEGYFLKFIREKSDEFVAQLLQIVKQHNIIGILCHHELHMVVLNQYRSEIEEHSPLLFVKQELLDSILDKSIFLEKARSLGVRTPDTFKISNADDIAMATKSFNFPGILKISINLEKSSLPKKWQFKSRYFPTTAAWESFMKEFPEGLQQEFILQEYITGKYIGVGLAIQRQSTVAAFQWIALREYEPGLGGFRKSVAINETLKKNAEKICAALNFEGVCEVEFRGNPDDIESIVLMEVNPRLWGGVSLPVECGVDFPYLVFSIHSGREQVAVTGYSDNIYSRNFLGDLKWFWKTAILGKTPFNDPNLFYSRWGAWRDFILSIGKADIHDLESFSDMGPSLSHYKKKIKQLIGLK